jgi:hypothetical protein
MEILEPHPSAAIDTFCNLEIAERDLQAIHGNVFKNNQYGKRDKDQQIQLMVSCQILKYPLVHCLLGVPGCHDYFLHHATSFHDVKEGRQPSQKGWTTFSYHQNTQRFRSFTASDLNKKW